MKIIKKTICFLKLCHSKGATWGDDQHKKNPLHWWIDRERKTKLYQSSIKNGNFSKKFAFFLAVLAKIYSSFIFFHLNSGGWMEIPAAIPNCPPGLEYLTMLDQLLIKQKVNLTQVLVGFEQNNKFVVKNSLGQDVRHTSFYWSQFQKCFHFIQISFYFECSGLLGRRRYWLLYSQLLRSNSSIRYESVGCLSKWSHSLLSSACLFILLLSMLFAIIGSVITTW